MNFLKETFLEEEFFLINFKSEFEIEFEIVYRFHTQKKNRFWDDWIRQPQQRKERACIRPEISRTRTFGKIGVSKYDSFRANNYYKLNCFGRFIITHTHTHTILFNNVFFFPFHSGMFFDKHLRYIKLNEQMVEFTKMNLTHLLKVICVLFSIKYRTRFRFWIEYQYIVSSILFSLLLIFFFVWKIFNSKTTISNFWTKFIRVQWWRLRKYDVAWCRKRVRFEFHTIPKINTSEQPSCLV